MPQYNDSKLGATTPSIPFSTSSTMLSPNHPINLRKQAQPQLDSSFSVKLYIGAANALLEKAQAADAQGQLEVAFVNYLKAAGVASFISKHDEWPQVQKGRGSVYQSYNELMKQVPAFIDRTKRIEEQLRFREERNAIHQRQDQAGRATPSYTLDDSAEQVLSSSETSPTVDSDVKDYNQTYSRTDSFGSFSSNSKPIVPQNSAQMRMSASLADRLQALRGAQVEPSTTDPSSKYHSGSVSTNSSGGIPRTMDLASQLKGFANLDSSQPQPPIARNGFSSPTLPRDETFSMHSMNHALAAKQNGEQAIQSFHPIPATSEFTSSYLTLDEFESNSVNQGNDDTPETLPNSNQHDPFPSAPLHPVGKAKRPLPMPPSLSSDVAREFTIARQVPEPFSIPQSRNTTASRKIDGLADPRRMSLQQQPRSQSSSIISTTPTVGAKPAPTGTGRTRASESPLSHPASLLVGAKPTPPMTNHITIEVLFRFLYPGFEEFTDSDGNQKIAKRRGMDVLLLDIRTRNEWETSRIKGGKTVCIEPIVLKEGMSSADIQDKLVLSPPEEQASFSARNEFDLVVLYDRNLKSLKGPTHHGRPLTPVEEAAQARMDIIIKAIYENEFRKTLKHQPVLLAGGFEAWSKSVGDKGVIRDRAPETTPPASDSSFNHYIGTESARPSISFEAGTRFPTANDTSSRLMANEQHTQDIKKTRRQQQILVDPGITRPSSPPLTKPSLQPGSLAPTRPSASTSFGAAIPGYGMSAMQGASTSFQVPSMPARTYQTPGTPTSIPPAAPSFPPSAATRSGEYFFNSHNTHQAALRSGPSSFDYPQLRHSNSFGLSAPQLPPAAASSNGVTSPSRSSRAQSISTPTPIPTSTSPDSSHKQLVAPAYVGSNPTGSKTYASSTNGRLTDDIRIGITGLKNLGNSCYMNATLQCLGATIPLARFLLDGSYKKAINRVNPLGTQGALAESFAQLIRVMWSEQFTFVSPVTFKEAIARFAPAFRGCDQHDSQEFLAILLDGIHEDLNYVVHKPPPVEMTPEREEELEKLPQQIASVKEWGIYRMRNDSLIVDWFQGQFRNKMTCLTCGKTSITYNAFMYLSLPIPHGRGIQKATLQQCLDTFVREEILDKADAWNCPRCKKPRKATKRLSISRLPQVLLIHLKRFSFKGPFTDKIDTTVTFPLSGLDLTNYMPPPLPPGAIAKGTPISQSQQPPYFYDLYGVTHHFGSLNTGHYTATIRNHGEWFYCDDSRIQKCDDRQIKTNSPYVLWFRRRPNN